MTASMLLLWWPLAALACQSQALSRHASSVWIHADGVIFSHGAEAEAVQLSSLHSGGAGGCQDMMSSAGTMVPMQNATIADCMDKCDFGTSRAKSIYEKNAITKKQHLQRNDCKSKGQGDTCLDTIADRASTYYNVIPDMRRYVIEKERKNQTDMFLTIAPFSTDSHDKGKGIFYIDSGCRCWKRKPIWKTLFHCNAGLTCYKLVHVNPDCSSSEILIDKGTEQVDGSLKFTASQLQIGSFNYCDSDAKNEAYSACHTKMDIKPALSRWLGGKGWGKVGK